MSSLHRRVLVLTVSCRCLPLPCFTRQDPFENRTVVIKRDTLWRSPPASASGWCVAEDILLKSGVVSIDTTNARWDNLTQVDVCGSALIISEGVHSEEILFAEHRFAQRGGLDDEGTEWKGGMEIDR